MNWKVDKKEIVDFINAAIDEPSVLDIETCINRFTEYTDEDYLDNRAEFIRKELEKDEVMIHSFRKLAMLCNEAEKCCNDCPVNKYCNHNIMQLRNNISEDSFKMIDLFCGAGGLSLGFRQEGFVTVLANDIEACCIDTYAHNHPETKRDRIILGDIKDVADDIENIVTEKVDVVVGGPPCQGFSFANRQRIIDDPRNRLYRYYVDIVSKVKPKFFVMENVKGMLSVADQVKEDFNKIGYSVSYAVLNAKDYGVPQNRERLIYIGNNIDIDNDIILNEIIDSSNKYSNTVLGDAILGLRPLQALTVKNSTELDSIESGFKIEKNHDKSINEYIKAINNGKSYSLVLNHKARYNNDRDIEIFGRLHQGDKSDDPKIADIMPYKSRSDIFKDKYYKLREDSVCKTITAHMKFDCNMYIHPTQARGLTPREAARVQSYPDDYFFRGSFTKTYMQIGNSVPPLLGRAIASILKKYIEEGE